MPNRHPQEKLAQAQLALTAGLTVLIFGVDLMLPRGVAIPMLYIVPILISTDCRQHWFRVAVVVACTGLTLLGYFFSSPGIPGWIAVSNRALAITAIWIVFALAWQRTQAREQADWLRDLLPICASCRKVHDHTGHWNQVEQYLERQTGTRLTQGICPDCLQTWYPNFYPQVAEQFPDLFKDAPRTIVGENRLRVARERP